MKAIIYKFLPIVVGVILGVLAVSPPQFLGLPLPARILIGLPAVALAFLLFTVIMISAAMPQDIKLTPIEQGKVTEDMMDLFLAYQDAGFQLAGPPIQVETAPPAVLVPLIDRTGQVYGTIFRTGTQPPKTACDMVTVFQQPRAGLTTGAAVEGASLPASPGAFHQVFKDADISTLYHQHLAAVEQLRQQGLMVKPASARDFPEDFRESINHSRAHFFRNPLWNALVIIYRSSTGTTPHLGPIANQPVARQTLARLREAAGLKA